MHIVCVLTCTMHVIMYMQCDSIEDCCTIAWVANVLHSVLLCLYALHITTAIIADATTAIYRRIQHR
jgi:hypothetical protein